MKILGNGRGYGHLEGFFLPSKRPADDIFREKGREVDRKGKELDDALPLVVWVMFLVIDGLECIGSVFRGLSFRRSYFEPIPEEHFIDLEVHYADILYASLASCARSRSTIALDELFGRIEILLQLDQNEQSLALAGRLKEEFCTWLRQLPDQRYECGWGTVSLVSDTTLELSSTHVPYRSRRPYEGAAEYGN
jgi:hypothetical protein